MKDRAKEMGTKRQREGKVEEKFTEISEEKKLVDNFERD